MKATHARRKKLLRYVFCYMLISLFCVILGAVYERFGHGIYSYRMIYAFLVPLVPGAMLLLVFVLRAVRLPGSGSLVLWNCGIAALNTGLLFHGVLDIYGTTSQWTFVYYIVSGIMFLTGILFYLIYDIRKHPVPNESDQHSDV